MNFNFGFRRRCRRRFCRIRMKEYFNLEDPERLLFGFGPCGEIAYQQYKKMKEKNKENDGQQN